MDSILQRKTSVKFLTAFLFSFLLVRCNDSVGTYNRQAEILVQNEKPALIAEKKLPASDEIAVIPPPFTDGIFPCSDCHKDLKPNPVRRELKDMHDDISAMFNHDSQNRWCLDCHDLNNRDSLRLASGKLLNFKESYKLCGQCHGDKLRDWKVGVHGKRTGEWNGKKQYYLCVSCHNPHSPKFPKLKPEPAPVRIDETSR